MRPELQQLHADIEDRHWWFTGRRRILRALVDELLPPGPPSGPSSAGAPHGDGGRATVVDIGCGTGANLGALQDRFHCIGFDLSEDAVRHARRRFPDVTFVRGDSPAALPREARDADLFLLMDVLEHVREDRALLAQVVEMARPGARILVTVPAGPGLWSEHDVSFGHHRRYTRDTLRALWQGMPVGVELFSALNSRLYPLAWAVRTVGRLRGRSAGPAGTDNVLPPAPLNALLSGIFASEAAVLRRALRSGGGGFRRGLSLATVLRREEGPRP